MKVEELKFSLRILIILSSTTATLAWNRANVRTLELLQVIMRHGERNPLWTFPLDPHGNDTNYWPGGFGQLTDRGVEQTHEVGRFLRERYDGFIGKTYSQDELSAWSSFLDRSIRSGISCLRGMYPKFNQSGTLYGDGEVSQVVPLRTLTEEEDDYIALSKTCPRWNALFNGPADSSLEAKKFLNETIDIAKSVAEYTGLGATVGDATKIFDYLVCQSVQNKSLPHWATPEILAFGKKFFSYGLELETLTFEMKMLRSRILKKVVENLEKKNSSSKAGKLVFYSGHDTTIVAFLNILGLYSGVWPTYASTVLIELHHNHKLNGYVVEIYFRDNVNGSGEPEKLEMENCSSPCPLLKFLEIANEFFPDDYERACQISTGSEIMISL